MLLKKFYSFAHETAEIEKKRNSFKHETLQKMDKVEGKNPDDEFYTPLPISPIESANYKNIYLLFINYKNDHRLREREDRLARVGSPDI